MSKAVHQQVVSMPLPENAVLLGNFQGFDLFHTFIPEARYSSRSMVYVYAKWMGASEITFTQMSAVHRQVAQDRTPEEIERQLTIDALSRVKHRITHEMYMVGKAYTSELSEADLG